jgi:hypothetical protein
VSVPATLGDRDAELPAEPETQHSAWLGTVRRALPIALIWVGSGAIFGVIATRVRDWYAMPNELLNEHRAIAVAQTLSPLPTLHRQFVRSYDQLYPLVIAPVFRYGSVLSDLRDAHALNAFVMTSACIPAYLLARRVTGSSPLAYLVAVLSVAMPWMLFVVMLMNEVVAYPIFLWAALAAQRTLVAPSRGRDAALLVSLPIAYLARTQLAVLAVAAPIAIVAFELGRSGGRVGSGLRASVSRHRLLAGVYLAAAAVAALLFVSGRLGATVGVYGQTITGDLFPRGMPGSFVWHLACFSIGVGILPVVVGTAWSLARLVRPPETSERHAFACFAATVTVSLLLEVTNFDLRFADRMVLDRYLVYLVPVVLLGFVCALQDRRAHRLSLAAVTVLVMAGFAVGPVPTDALMAINADTPIQEFYPSIVHAAGSLANARILLAGGTALLSVIYLAARLFLPRRTFQLVFAIVPLAVVPYVTADLFTHFFHDTGWSLRAVTSSAGSSYGWIDQRVGPNADVTIVPYPVSTAYLVNMRVWRDYEFWNKSVDRDFQLSPPGVFEYTNDTFPKVWPTFDPRTGRASVSGGPYVAEADQETRARISGTAIEDSGGVTLIRADRPWRADWVSSGLYDDGWTKPGQPVRVKVFARPAATSAEFRWLTFGLRGPDDDRTRPVTIAADPGRWHGLAGASTQWATVKVCVPKGGYAEATLHAPVVSTIPGDLASLPSSDGTRSGGIFISQISVSDDVGGSCKPGPPPSVR